MTRLIIGSIISDNLYYLICVLLSLLVLLGIYLMSKVEKAALGNAVSAIAVGLGITLTLIYKDILPYWILYIAMGIGSVLGLILALKVKMIEVPELVAFFDGVGGAT